MGYQTDRSFQVAVSTARAAALGTILGFGLVATVGTSPAQATATAPAANRALGTVKSVSGGTLTIATDSGQTVTVTLANGTRVQQLAPGSTDLKTAEASTADAIAEGDRVLVSGTPGDPGTLTAIRVILMKSTAIAQRNQASQADWTRRGTGGIVTAVDPAGKTVAVSSGTRKVMLDVTDATVYRRYAPGSVKFEEAKPSSFAEIHAGDQLRVRGDRSTDGLTLKAEEIVSGSFKNLSGTIVTLNPTGNTFVIKDLATKKNETVTIGSESDLRSLPPEMAARFAARSRPGGSAGGAPAAPAPGSATTGTAPGEGGAGRQAARGASDANGAGRGLEAAGRAGGSGAGPSGAGPTGAAGGRAGGGDLSQIIPRLPKATLADLKAGEALMVVASGSSGGPYTAITVLSGVEPLLTGPAGSGPTLSPWSLGGGGGEGGGTSE